MNKRWSFVMTSTLGIAGVLVMGGAPRTSPTAVGVAREMDGAFCDGEFLAKLDADSGKEPRIQSGRWITNGDRALFIAGYQQGHGHFAADRPGRMGPVDTAELAGYRDGMLDGEKQRDAMEPFRMNRTEKYLNAGQGPLEANTVSENYKHDYRLGYANGYQVGYYSEVEKGELGSGNDKSGHM